MVGTLSRFSGLLTLLLGLSPHAFSECQMTTFQDGSVASATEMNCNFEVLQSDVDNLETAIATVDPSRILWVAKEGGDYSSLSQAAGQLGSLLVNSDEPVLIKIGPGVYEEPAVTVLEFRPNVYIQGAGRNVTVLQYQTDSPGISIINSEIRNGITDITIKNLAGPAVEVAASGGGFKFRTESYFYMSGVTLSATSSSNVAAFASEGPVWVQIRETEVYAVATAPLKSVSGLSVQSAEWLSIDASEVWANGGFLTRGLYSVDTDVISVTNSKFQIARSLPFLGTYSDEVGVADGVYIEGEAVGVARHVLQGVQILAESSPSTGTGRGVVAASGARVLVTGSVIETASGCASSPCNPSYGATAFGVVSNNPNKGSRIDVVGGLANGGRSCTDDCRDVCYMGVVVSDAVLATECEVD